MFNPKVRAGVNGYGVIGQQTGMRILIAGASGMIGSAVAPFLAEQGHTVVRLVRRAPGEGEVGWDPDAGTIDGAPAVRFTTRLKELIESGYGLCEQDLNIEPQAAGQAAIEKGPA